MDTRSVNGRAVVVGAGVMGAQIAAHLANAGWNAGLLDIVPEGAEDPTARSAPAAKGLERARKARPAAFFLPDYTARVCVGNIVDDLDRIREADWVIEAVVEKPEVKRQVHALIEAHLGPETIVTTNTSGLSLADMAEGRSDSFRARFFGTHFFNPPRYMKLLEIIPTAQTDSAILRRFHDFGETVLGKRLVT